MRFSLRWFFIVIATLAIILIVDRDVSKRVTEKLSLQGDRFQMVEPTLVDRLLFRRYLIEDGQYLWIVNPFGSSSVYQR